MKFREIAPTSCELHESIVLPWPNNKILTPGHFLVRGDDLFLLRDRTLHTVERFTKSDVSRGISDMIADIFISRPVNAL